MAGRSLLVRTVSGSLVASFAVCLTPSTSEAAPTKSQLIRLYEDLNDFCRDGAGSKTEKACDDRDSVAAWLKAENACVGELGRFVPCAQRQR